MDRSRFCLAVAAALLTAVPAFAHLSHAGGNREIRDLQEHVTGLNNDIRRDNQALTADERKLITLETQAAEAQVGKAPPLSVGEQRELRQLQDRIGGLNRDIGRDTRQLTADQTKLKARQEPAP